MARRRFFVDQVHHGQAHITGPNAHHLTRVLRVEAGQKFEISDNRNVYLAEVQAARKDLVSFAIVEPIEAARAAVRLHLIAALIRFERFEWLLEKATELGVERVTPFEAERSEKGLASAAAKRLSRWTRIVREASEQSRRAHLPEISTPSNLNDALRDAHDARYVLEETSAPPILSAIPSTRHPEDRVALLVGPEGGWTDRERAAIQSSGWSSVSLGANILKTETAAVAALAILSAAWPSG